MHMQRLGLAARGNSPCWVQALLLSAMESACGETGTEGSDGRMHAEGVSEGFEFNPGQLFLRADRDYAGTPAKPAYC